MNKEKIAIILAIVVVILVSFVKLGTIPRAFYWDEAALGYYGFTLNETGTDEYGVKWPRYFKSSGDYKYPVYSYLSSISVGLFGLSEFSARFVSAFSGVIIFIYLIKFIKLFEIFNKKPWLYLVFGLCFAFTPWYLLFARTAREAMLGTAFITVGIYYLIKGEKERGFKTLLLSLAAFLLAGMTYSAMRMFLSVFLFGIIFIFKDKKKFITLFLIVFLSFVGMTLDPLSRLRAQGAVNLVSEETVRQAQKEVFEVGLSLNNKLGIGLARVFSNKIAIKSLEWINSYLAHFDVSYLFTRANPNLSWYFVPKMGLLLLVSSLFLILGVLKLFQKDESNRKWLFIFLWIAAGALPSALTVESPNPIRQLVAFPAFMLLFALGLGSSFIKRKFVKSILMLLLLVNVVFSFKQFFIHRENGEVWYSNQGVDETMKYIASSHNEYRYVVMPEDPYIFLLFYGKDFGLRGNQMKVRDRQWSSVVSLENIIFHSPDKCPRVGKKDILYLCVNNGGVKSVPLNAKVHHVSYFNDGEPSFILYEFLPKGSDMGDLPKGLKYDEVEYLTTSDGLIGENEANYWDSL